MTDMVKLFVGYTLVADLASTNNERRGAAMTSILGNYADEELKAVFKFHGIPDPEAHLEREKNALRNLITSSLALFATDKLKNSVQTAQDKIEKINTANPNGTTAELAVKLGMSKKQVRKLRAEGKLEEIIATNNN